MTEITDEMVERAYGWSPKGCGIQRWQIRDMLTAALNPKPEPEIDVTQVMQYAGVKAALDYEENNATFPWRRWPFALLIAIYRAMEKARLEELKGQEVAYKRERECRQCFGTGQDFVHGRHPGPALTCKHCNGTGERKAQEGAAYAAKDARQGASAGAPVKETGEWWRKEMPHSRANDLAGPRYHRRNGDPK